LLLSPDFHAENCFELKTAYFHKNKTHLRLIKTSQSHRYFLTPKAAMLLPPTLKRGYGEKTEKWDNRQKKVRFPVFFRQVIFNHLNISFFQHPFFPRKQGRGRFSANHRPRWH
jgi:hypothetical protein